MSCNKLQMYTCIYAMSTSTNELYCSFSNKWTGGRLKVNTNVVYISGVRTTSPVLYIHGIQCMHFLCIVKCMEQRDWLNVQFTITARSVCK